MTDISYTVVVVPDTEDGGYYAYIPDLQGCMGDGDTPQDAVADVIAAAESWAIVRAEQGREMPEPGESERNFDAAMKMTDEHIAALESEIADLKAQLRRADRKLLASQSGAFSGPIGKFEAA